MGSRFFNLIANRWTAKFDKDTPSEVDYLSGTKTPTSTTTATPTTNTATTSVRESSSPPSSVDASFAATPDGKMEVEKNDETAADDVQQRHQEQAEVEDDDIEGMDMKAKALTKLLQTSSVFVAIMADKMKEQQKQQQEAARRRAAKRQAEAAKEASTPAYGRRSTRSKGTEEASQEQAVAEKNNKPASKKTSAKKGTATKRGFQGKSITSYFQKADVEVKEDNPTVQEALAQAADELEAKPTAIGEQEGLVATEQPALVSGGKMRQYQLEGLEWMKSLWMNGLCGILADEMGLGKTVQAISLIAFFKENNISGPFLIAAPLSTVGNWVDEFQRWTPRINTILYHGSKDERAELRKQMKLKDQKSMDFPVVCTSYEICMNDRAFLSQFQWRYIVVDEGHRLKNMNCKLIKELLTYNSANRLLITGTPLQNNISELWSLLHFLLPEIFNDLDSFESWFDFSSVLDRNGQKDVVEKRKRNLVTTMHSILKPFLLRRVKTDVETDLPKKREYILYAPLTGEQKELYREILNGTGRQYLENKAIERIEAKSGRPSRSTSVKRKAEDSGNSTPTKSRRTTRSSTPNSTVGRTRKGRQSYREIGDREFNAQLRRLEMGIEDESEKEDSPGETEQEELERAKTIKLAKKEIGSKKLQNPVMQARLACNSPHNFYWPWGEDSSTVDETLVTASGKMLLLDRLVPCLMRKGHKVLIFSQFKTQLDLLQDWAALRKWKCCRIDGAVSQIDRREQIKAFNMNKDYKIFLLSTRAGGQGINLTAADTVILYDSDWNPQQDLQAQDRAHRIGQTRPVIVYRLATKGTVEQTLLEKADSKRRLERLVIQKGKFKSLLDNNGTPATSQNEVEELRKALGEDEFEQFHINSDDPQSILSEEDLAILTDRSEEAYARAEKGLETTGRVFQAVETKEDQGIMAELTVR